jgi:hypothetical protein
MPITLIVDLRDLQNNGKTPRAKTKCGDNGDKAVDMGKRSKNGTCFQLFLITSLIALACCGCQLGRQPSNHRKWTLEHAVLPCAHFQDGVVKVRNVRDFRHKSETYMIPAYRDVSIELDQIATVDLFLCYFDNPQSPFAHSMLSFGTYGEQYLLLSIEGRREEGEEYNLRNAACRELELIYVLADERDVIDQRAVVRGETVRRFSLNATPNQARKLLVRLLCDANRLHSEPRFYRLLKDNCTSNLAEPSGAAIGGPLQQAWVATFPGYADRKLRRLGLIDDSLPLRDQRAAAEINGLAKLYRNADQYSLRIRGH